MVKHDKQFNVLYDNGTYTASRTIYDINKENGKIKFLIFDSMFNKWMYVDSNKCIPID